MDPYLFHQTPNDLCVELLKFLTFDDSDIVLEPFRGEGGFYNNFPDNVVKEWCEITKGKDWQSYTGNIDWVVTNPPFRLENNLGRRENAFFKILIHYCKFAKKGIAFLGNDYCLGTLTPKRIKEINELGFYIHKIVVCSVKKWRGRYFFIVLKKEKNDLFQGLLKSF